jgi:hypothetical protein
MRQDFLAQALGSLGKMPGQSGLKYRRGPLVSATERKYAAASLRR